jgi:hypothetical protein
MDRETVVRSVREATFEFYQLGMSFNGAKMIPPAPQRSIVVQSGPVRFLVEPRHLDDAAVAANNGESPDLGPLAYFDDFGPSLHVFSVADGLEYLRFDCFDNKPHYHYARHSADENITVRIDQFAEGSPLDWALRTVRTRLPEMLEYAGADTFALQVREYGDQINGALDSVQELMRSAEAQVILERASQATGS